MYSIGEQIKIVNTRSPYCGKIGVVKDIDDDYGIVYIFLDGISVAFGKTEIMGVSNERK